MKIVKTASVRSDGTDILYSGIILNEASKDKAIEICNNYINRLHMKDSSPSEVQAYDLMHCTAQFIGCDVSKLKDAPIETMHSDAICYVNKVGIYYTFEDGKLIPQNIGLHVDINTSNISSKYFTKGENSHITVALCNSKASAKNTNKCFQNINNGIEYSTCIDIGPIFMSGKFEFVNTKHKIINEIPDRNKLYDMIRAAEMKSMSYSQKYALDTSILRKFGVDDQTILILNRVGLNKISDITRVLDSNSKKIKSLKGIAAKRYTSLVTAINKLLDTSYSITF